eukprot:783484-Amphidinium_carterae.1
MLMVEGARDRDPSPPIQMTDRNPGEKSPRPPPLPPKSISTYTDTKKVTTTSSWGKCKWI